TWRECIIRHAGRRNSDAAKKTYGRPVFVTGRTGYIGNAVCMEPAPSDESTIRCMTIGLITRPATTADAPALAALVNSAYRGDSSKAGWTTEADLLDGQRVDVQGLTETIARPGTVILLHERDQRPVACVHLERTGQDCYLGMLTTRPIMQGAGLGRQMLEEAERWAIEHWSTRTMHMTVIVQR